MHTQRKRFAYAEISIAEGLIRSGNLDQAFTSLERAHVAGQPYILPHVLSHWHMMRIGMRRRSVMQVWGQVLRLVLGTVGSAIGIIPTGNTGGTNLALFQTLPIDPDLENAWLRNNN